MGAVVDCTHAYDASLQHRLLERLLLDVTGKSMSIARERPQHLDLVEPAMQLRVTCPRVNIVVLMGLVLRWKAPHPRDSDGLWFELSHICALSSPSSLKALDEFKFNHC